MKRFWTLVRWFVVIMLILGALHLAGFEVPAPFEKLREPVRVVAAIEKAVWDIAVKVVNAIAIWVFKILTGQAAT